MAKTRIKQMSSAKMAERQAATKLKAVNDIGATIGLPEAQRSHAVDIKVVEQIGNDARTTDRTLRKLTRVEKLRRSGVLEPHEADACEYYADVAALAWDTVGCTANHCGMGSGNYVGATARAHDANVRIADAREDYRFISAVIPAHYKELFEAVICQNSSIADMAGANFGTLARSQREHKTRAIVKLCANLVHGVVANRLPIENAPAPAAKIVVELVEAPQPLRIIDAIDAEIAAKPEATTILMSEDVHAAMRRELGVGELASYRALEVLLRPSWRWAWILQ